MKILAIDTSVNDVGWATAYFQHPKRIKWDWGTFKLEGNNYQMKLLDLVQQIDRVVEEFDFLIVEWPMFFAHSARGAIAAHNNYTIDLAGVAAYIAGWYRMDHRNSVFFTPTVWKGTVSKRITARRFFQRFKGVRPESISEHAIDATMMLRFYMLRQGLINE